MQEDKQSIHTQTQLFRIGSAQFTFAAIEAVMPHICTHPQIYLILSNEKDQSQIDYGKYVRYQWKKIFNSMTASSSIEQLQLAENNSNEILKEISHVAFPNLQILTLISNNIASVEPIALMQMPKLQFLYLSRNLIAHCSSLRKANINNLQKLIINDNPMLSIEKISEIHALSLNALIIEVWSRDSWRSMITDLSILTKISSKKLKYLNAKSDYRIMQERVLSQLRKKFKKIEIAYKTEQEDESDDDDFYQDQIEEDESQGQEREREGTERDNTQNLQEQ